MGEITDAALLAQLRRQLTLAAAKQAVATSNLANVSTPGFRARQLDFAGALDSSMRGAATLSATDPRHLAGAPVESATTREADGLPSRRDGNNVQIDHELLQMSQAQGEFNRAQAALSAKFRLVRYAISEGR